MQENERKKKKGREKDGHSVEREIKRERMKEISIKMYQGRERKKRGRKGGRKKQAERE